MITGPTLTEQNLEALRQCRTRATEAFAAYHQAISRVLALRRPRWQTIPWAQEHELSVCCLRSALPAKRDIWMHPDGFYVWGGFRFYPTLSTPEFQTGVAINSKVLKFKGAAQRRFQTRLTAAAASVALCSANAAWEQSLDRPTWTSLSGPGPDDWSYRIGEWKRFTEAVSEKLFLWADVTSQLLARR